MTKSSVMRALIVLTPWLGMTSLVGADPPVDEKARAEEFRAFAKREAAAYTLRLEGSDRLLTLQPEPVLKWSNPVIGTVYGDVFIWTDQGRPEAVASIYRFYTPPFHRANEFHSLALGRISGERGGAVVWSPFRAGLELKPIPGAPRRPTPPPHGSARCAPWRRSSPVARPTVRGSTATCDCSPSPSIAMRTPRAT